MQQPIEKPLKARNEILQYIHIHIHTQPQIMTILRPHMGLTLKLWHNRYKPVFIGTWLEGLVLYYKFYCLSLDADIVHCWSGTASELWPSTLHWLTRYQCFIRGGGGARILRLGAKSVLKSLLAKGKGLCQAVAWCRWRFVISASLWHGCPLPTVASQIYLHKPGIHSPYAKLARHH